MLFEIGAAVIGGVANAAAGSDENNQIEQQRQRMLAYLQENIIDPGELDRLLANVNRMFNNRLVNTLNSTAIRSRGIANNNVVKGAVAGELEGQRINTLEETRSKALENNREVNYQMANVIGATAPRHNFFGDFTSGALAGASVGMELSKMLKPNTIDPETQPTVESKSNPSIKPSLADSFKTPAANSIAGITLGNGPMKSALDRSWDSLSFGLANDGNPFINKLKIEYDDLTNYGYSRFWNR